MSASPRLNASTLIPKLTLLFATALHLIQKGSRDYKATKKLVEALQVFKDPNYAKKLADTEGSEITRMHHRRKKLQEYVRQAGPECHEVLFAEVLSAIKPKPRRALRGTYANLFQVLTANPEWIRDIVGRTAYVWLWEALEKIGLHFGMTIQEIEAIFPKIDTENRHPDLDLVMSDYGEQAPDKERRFRLKLVGRNNEAWGETEEQAVAAFIASHPEYFRLRFKEAVVKPRDYFSKRG